MQQYEGRIVYDQQGRPHKIVNGQPVLMPAAPEQSPGLQQIVAPTVDPTSPYEAPKAQADLNNANLSGQKTQQEIGLDRSKFVTDLFGRHNSDVAVLRYRNSIDRAMAALTAGPTPQDDQSVVYAWAKVMDPAGAVQQGDVDLAKMTGSIADQARSYLDSISTGKGLPKGVREGLIKNIRNQVSTYRKSYEQSRTQYESLAKSAGVDPKLVIGEHAGAPFFKDEKAWMERQSGGQEIARGEFKTSPDNRKTAALNAMIRAGIPFEEANAFATEGGGSPLDPNVYARAVAFARDPKNKGYKGNLAEATVTERTTLGERTAAELQRMDGGVGAGLLKGGLHAWDRAAVGAESLLNKALPDSMQLNAASQAQAARPNFWGNIPTDDTAETAGKILGAGVLSAPFGSPFVQGALGNVLAGDSNNAGGIATDAVIGGVGGKVGDMAIRGLAGAIAPQVDPAVQRLAQQGVKLRPGRMFGGSAPLREDLLRSYPVVGPKIDQLAERELATLSKVQPNRALGELGMSLPDNVAPGHETVRYTKDAISNAYNQNLQGAQIGLDPTFITRMNYLGQRSNMRPQELGEFEEILQREVGGAFANGKGSMSGRDFKRLDERLGQLSTGFGKMDDPYKRQIGEAIGFTNEQMRALARRQNPQMADGLRQADRAFAQFAPFERAAAMAPDGIPTPGQMRTASRANDMSRRKGLTARGEATMQELAEDASRILPAERGNSGTADRLNQTDWKAWALGSVASPLYSQPAIDVVEQMMLRNPGLASQRAANFIRSRALPRGMFGAALPAYAGQGN